MELEDWPLRSLSWPRCCPWPCLQHLRGASLIRIFQASGGFQPCHAFRMRDKQKCNPLIWNTCSPGLWSLVSPVSGAWLCAAGRARWLFSGAVQTVFPFRNRKHVGSCPQTKKQRSGWMCGTRSCGHGGPAKMKRRRPRRMRRTFVVLSSKKRARRCSGWAAGPRRLYGRRVARSGAELF